VLLVSAYVMLTVLDHVPFWLMLTVAFRDLLIVGGYLTYTSLVGPVVMHPSRLSKINTLMQLILVVVILLHEALGVSYPFLIDGLIYAVLITTVASGAHYLWAWIIKKQVELDETPRV
jgi:cardiolipin synthase